MVAIISKKMNTFRGIFYILLSFTFSFSAFGASVPPYEQILNCKCDQKVQTHFFKDLKNKSVIQISKASCKCAEEQKEVTAICPTKKRALKKFMVCAKDRTISAERSSSVSSDLPANSEGTSNETQDR